MALTLRHAVQFAFDTDRGAGPIGRVRLMDSLVAMSPKPLSVPVHVTFPALGYIAADGDYFRFSKAVQNVSPGVSTTCPA